MLNLEPKKNRGGCPPPRPVLPDDGQTIIKFSCPAIAARSALRGFQAQFAAPQNCIARSEMPQQISGGMQSKFVSRGARLGAARARASAVTRGGAAAAVAAGAPAGDAAYEPARA